MSMTKTIGSNISSKIKGLSALAVAVVMFSGCAATTAVTETAQEATKEATQTISGDSGSVEAAAAEETTVGETVAAADAKSAKPKVICSYERVTGSHRKTKVCRTAEQIAERRAQDQKTISGVLSTPSGGPQG